MNLRAFRVKVLLRVQYGCVICVTFAAELFLAASNGGGWLVYDVLNARRTAMRSWRRSTSIDQIE